jgi:hypothetical protein
MSAQVYTVKATVGHAWASEYSSVILTTLDKTKALSFAKTYEEENRLSAISLAGYDDFCVSVYEYILEEECNEVLIYDSFHKEDVALKNTRIPRLFSEEYIMRELEYFYQRKNSTTPSIINTTLGDVFHGYSPKLVKSQEATDYYLHFIEKALERKVVFTEFEEEEMNKANIMTDHIEDSLDWELYNTFEKSYH